MHAAHYRARTGCQGDGGPARWRFDHVCHNQVDVCATIGGRDTAAPNIVLIGPPGCGKGTQATRIANRYAIPHISTGDILRAAVQDGSPLGRAVEATLASGGLVGDDLMTDLVCQRLDRPDTLKRLHPRRVSADRSPRRRRSIACPAARRLIVLLFAVADSEILRRLGTRRVCAHVPPDAVGVERSRRRS